MLSTVKFAQLGADPEYIAVYRGRLKPACRLFTTTYLGCDGHDSTAELRPPPSRNVHQLLRTIGHGLVNAADLLPGIEFHAAPEVLSEKLGGHIHLSFFYKDMDFQSLIAAGESRSHPPVDPILNASTTLRPAQQPPGTPQYSPEIGARLSARPWELCTPGIVAGCLAYLLQPLEEWVQPVTLRRARNQAYGSLWDVRTDNPVRRPIVEAYKDYGWTKYEIRYPSTWLAHPLLAYLYLGSAKLCCLAWEQLAPMVRARLREMSLSRFPEGTPESAFTQRLEFLSPRTHDLRDLPGAAKEFAHLGRPYMAGTNTQIDINAWRKIL